MHQQKAEQSSCNLAKADHTRALAYCSEQPLRDFGAVSPARVAVTKCLAVAGAQRMPAAGQWGPAECGADPRSI
jgi:hypothetical protein